MFDPDEFIEAFPGDITKATDLRIALSAAYKLGAKESESKLEDALDKADRFDRAEVWAGKLEVENAALVSRLDACLDLIADAVANHESGGRCDMDLARAAVILARNEGVVEKHTHSYGDDGRCSCGIHALD